MCRFTLYLGPPIRLASLLTEPEHSLIRQSAHAQEREEPLNGDGFGVGWYISDDGEEPAVFRSVRPAWNNRNVTNLARAISSPCILAHVRAATSGIPVNEANCHPFQFGRYLLMQNGFIGSFPQIKRVLMESVCDTAYNNVFGSTDTEHLFAVFIDELLKRPDEEDAPLLLARSLAATITRVLELVKTHGNGEESKLNVAVSDGRHAVISRYIGGDTDPPSLYYIQRELYEPAAKDSPGRRRYERSGSVVVSSERLTEDPDWTVVPPNHLVALSREAPARLFSLDDGELTEV